MSGFPHRGYWGRGNGGSNHPNRPPAAPRPQITSFAKSDTAAGGNRPPAWRPRPTHTHSQLPMYHQQRDGGEGGGYGGQTGFPAGSTVNMGGPGEQFVGYTGGPVSGIVGAQSGSMQGTLPRVPPLLAHSGAGVVDAGGRSVVFASSNNENVTGDSSNSHMAHMGSGLNRCINSNADSSASFNTNTSEKNQSATVHSSNIGNDAIASVRQTHSTNIGSMNAKPTSAADQSKESEKTNLPADFDAVKAAKLQALKARLKVQVKGGSQSQSELPTDTFHPHRVPTSLESQRTEIRDSAIAAEKLRNNVVEQERLQPPAYQSSSTPSVTFDPAAQISAQGVTKHPAAMKYVSSNVADSGSAGKPVQAGEKITAYETYSIPSAMTAKPGLPPPIIKREDKDQTQPTAVPSAKSSSSTQPLQKKAAGLLPVTSATRVGGKVAMAKAISGNVTRDGRLKPPPAASQKSSVGEKPALAASGQSMQVGSGSGTAPGVTDASQQQPNVEVGGAGQPTKIRRVSERSSPGKAAVFDAPLSYDELLKRKMSGMKATGATAEDTKVSVPSPMPSVAVPPPALPLPVPSAASSQANVVKAIESHAPVTASDPRNLVGAPRPPPVKSNFTPPGTSASLPNRPPLLAATQPIPKSVPVTSNSLAATAVTSASAVCIATEASTKSLGTATATSVQSTSSQSFKAGQLHAAASTQSGVTQPAVQPSLPRSNSPQVVTSTNIPSTSSTAPQQAAQTLAFSKLSSVRPPASGDRQMSGVGLIRSSSASQAPSSTTANAGASVVSGPSGPRLKQQSSSSGLVVNIPPAASAKIAAAAAKQAEGKAWRPVGQAALPAAAKVATPSIVPSATTSAAVVPPGSKAGSPPGRGAVAGPPPKQTSTLAPKSTAAAKQGQVVASITGATTMKKQAVVATDTSGAAMPKYARPEAKQDSHVAKAEVPPKVVNNSEQLRPSEGVAKSTVSLPRPPVPLPLPSASGVLPNAAAGVLATAPFGTPADTKPAKPDAAAPVKVPMVKQQSAVKAAETLPFSSVTSSALPSTEASAPLHPLHSAKDAQAAEPVVLQSCALTDASLNEAFEKLALKSEHPTLRWLANTKELGMTKQSEILQKLDDVYREGEKILAQEVADIDHLSAMDSLKSVTNFSSVESVDSGWYEEYFRDFPAGLEKKNEEEMIAQLDAWNQKIEMRINEFNAEHLQVVGKSIFF